MTTTAPAASTSSGPSPESLTALSALRTIQADPSLVGWETIGHLSLAIRQLGPKILLTHDIADMLADLAADEEFLASANSFGGSSLRVAMYRLLARLEGAS